MSAIPEDFENSFINTTLPVVNVSCGHIRKQNAKFDDLITKLVAFLKANTTNHNSFDVNVTTLKTFAESIFSEPKTRQEFIHTFNVLIQYYPTTWSKYVVTKLNYPDVAVQSIWADIKSELVKSIAICISEMSENLQYIIHRQQYIPVKLLKWIYCHLFPDFPKSEVILSLMCEIKVETIVKINTSYIQHPVNRQLEIRNEGLNIADAGSQNGPKDVPEQSLLPAIELPPQHFSTGQESALSETLLSDNERQTDLRSVVLSRSFAFKKDSSGRLGILQMVRMPYQKKSSLKTSLTSRRLQHSIVLNCCCGKKVTCSKDQHNEILFLISKQEATASTIN
ncbi:hypothetical protein KQX54_001175 [Cotesia glomerata]|uniref:Uncharacterized protein n=1 Tax=Cotesia glomerata TaxID=32391 RepID=A0AAV7IYM9_COTGL|nr:hypothetical protein KQX54_001175 [Cotesia glomerata]